MNEQSHPERHPTISVCIANYNGEKLLDTCLESVRAQELSGSVEILVHDDASTDGSLEILSDRHPDVIVIASEENVGYCRSNNRLADRAQGEFLLLLNNDAALRSGALQALMDVAARAPDPSILTLAQYDWKTGRLVDKGMRLDFLHTPVANRDGHCKRLAYVQGACMFLRRDAWMRLGGFPEWMVSNAEDIYLCALARLRGGSIGVTRGSGYDHRQGTSFGGNRLAGKRLHTTYRRRYLSERNRASLVLVCTPTWLAWPLYVLHLLLLLFEGLFVSALKRDLKAWKTIYWKSVRDSAGMLVELRRARKKVQAERQIGLWSYVRIFDLMPHKLALLFRYGLPRFK